MQQRIKAARLKSKLFNIEMLDMLGLLVEGPLVLLTSALRSCDPSSLCVFNNLLEYITIRLIRLRAFHSTDIFLQIPLSYIVREATHLKVGKGSFVG